MSTGSPFGDEPFPQPPWINPGGWPGSVMLPAARPKPGVRLLGWVGTRRGRWLAVFGFVLADVALMMGLVMIAR